MIPGIFDSTCTKSNFSITSPFRIIITSQIKPKMFVHHSSHLSGRECPKGCQLSLLRSGEGGLRPDEGQPEGQLMGCPQGLDQNGTACALGSVVYIFLIHHFVVPLLLCPGTAPGQGEGLKTSLREVPI